MGRPSMMIVSLVFVTFNDPLGIGVAVTSTEVEAAAGRSDPFVVDLEAPSDSFADKELDVAPAKAAVLGKAETVACSSVEGVEISVLCAFCIDVDVGAAERDAVSSRGSTA